MTDTGLLRYVNPLQGTESVYPFSNGNTLPLAALPNGMAAWSPQTNEAGGGWFYHPSHRHLQGFRLTHQPSPWIGDYGSFTLMPQTGPLRTSPDMRSASFRPEELTVAPDYIRAYLRRYQATMELTPSKSGARIRLCFEGDASETRLLLAPEKGDSSVRIDAAARRVSGCVKGHNGELPDNFALHFVIEFDCELLPESSGVFDGKHATAPELEGSGEKVGAFVGIRPSRDGIVNIAVGTSFIGLEQAERNLRNELAGKSFDQAREEAGQAWEKRLSVVRIEDEGQDSEEKKRIFYSSLYRVNLFPRAIHENDPEKGQVHYSPFDGSIRKGPMYVDFGFWDLYRTSLPLYSLLYPTLLAEMAEGWVNVFKESGWMPKWPSPGERSAMPGTLVDAAFADVFAKGLNGFDRQSAYEGLKKHATLDSGEEKLGRRGLADYARLGYLPSDRFHESVSNALDYHYGDFSLSVIAKELGMEEEAGMFRERAGNYRLLFDPEVGFMRARREDGSWQEPFDPLAWGGAYCEGGPWQCSWAVPHDIAGLAELIGGREALKAKLDELMTMKPLFAIGGYGMEIHEMSEMAAVDFGQFALSNQPSMHIPYMYAAIGAPSGTQHWARRAMEELFGSGSDGFPGDEDNGSMGAWFVWNAIGLYPLCPGTGEYVFGSPLFGRLTITLENGAEMAIEAEGNGPDKPYWSALEVNGEAWDRLYVLHEDLLGGATLRFRMSAAPSDRWYPDEALPYSMSLRRP
ncbi:putative alpha-1,2-mannosidase [Cohnella thailandensis]|uniref:Glycoside hydrolase family 92 protein n=2 Tax=Cohnella thailandensis TaxID=557557 RepID=A0A841SY76_9BACL|nr:glycoside hydrolase family 92 protein [Cohnella thailandensis]MBP1974359.1 putative alpha-1,2-mannosidase [Cohnella thailandensis]